MALTKSDKKFLKETFLTKENGVTKDDLKESLNDMRSQILDAVDGKLKVQEKNILETMDKKLAAQTDEIVKDVAKTIVPLIDEHDQRITTIETAIGIRAAD